MTLLPAEARPGLSDLVHDSQRIFRSVMDALARPAEPRALTGCPAACHGLSPEAAAILLTLADYDTPVWLDPRLAADHEIAAYLRFHTGARIITDPATATFAVITDVAAMPALETFTQGTPEDPDRSTTLIVQADEISATGPLFHGPGLPAPVRFSFSPCPVAFASQWLLNTSRFPLGIDLVVVAPGQVAAMPRSLRLLGD